MSIYWVALCYGVAAALAFLLLYRFEPVGWIWHLIAVSGALVIGLAPLPPQWSTPQGTLAVGSAFLFLVLWGSFFPLFRRFHYHRRTSV
jgi:hypothetical protein